jgi:hypothetical protein
MKIALSILALTATAFLGQRAFGDDYNPPLALAITQDGHGHQHFLYYQTLGDPSDTSVALVTSSGGGVNAPEGTQRTQADNGDVRFVEGTNQHGQATAAYIPVTSHFSQAGL